MKFAVNSVTDALMESQQSSASAGSSPLALFQQSTSQTSDDADAGRGRKGDLEVLPRKIEKLKKFVDNHKDVAAAVETLLEFWQMHIDLLLAAHIGVSHYSNCIVRLF